MNYLDIQIQNLIKEETERYFFSTNHFQETQNEYHGFKNVET